MWSPSWGAHADGALRGGHRGGHPHGDHLSSLEPAHLVLDGEAVGQLAPEDRVEVELIPDAARLALLPEDSLYRNFRDRFL